MAVSPNDGKVLATVSLPDGAVGIAWWDGALAATVKDPNRLVRIDVESGAELRSVPVSTGEWLGCVTKVGRRFAVGDYFNGCVSFVDPDRPDEQPTMHLAGAGPGDLAATDDGIWHVDYWSPLVIKSDLDGTLLDWGEKVSGGIAWDGEHL